MKPNRFSVPAHAARAEFTALRPTGAAVLLSFLAAAGAVNAAGLEVAAVKLLSEHGSTRSTRYAVTNKILTLDGKTHVAWLDSISQTMLATYDHASGTWSDAIKIGDGADNHGGPALTCDRRGFLHVVFGPHSGPFQHCRSARPNDASQWVRLHDFGDQATYPSVVCDDADTLHIVYRGGDDPRKLLYQRRPKDGHWAAPSILARPDIKSGYTHYHAALTITRDQALHISYDLFFDGAAKCAGHMMSHDRGHTWTLADGTAIHLPVTPASDVFFKRTDDALKTVGLVCDAAGHPWIAVSGPEIWHHDGAAWRRILPGELLPPHVDGAKLASSGPLTLDTADRLYLVAMFERDVVLVHSDNRGQSFDLLRIYPPDHKLPHTGLTIERPTGHHAVESPWLLFATGEKGPDCYGKDIYQQVRAVRLAR